MLSSCFYSKSQEELTKEGISVNSVHSMILHTCTAHTNKRINIEAIAQDLSLWGISEVTVEAFSVKDTKFCSAIKWHPELLPNDKITDVIFKRFIEACKKIN